MFRIALTKSKGSRAEASYPAVSSDACVDITMPFKSSQYGVEMKGTVVFHQCSPIDYGMTFPLSHI